MKDPAQVRSVAVLRDRVGGGLVLQAAWGARLYVEMTKEKKLAKVELTERLWHTPRCRAGSVSWAFSWWDLFFPHAHELPGSWAA
jgi:hypothetical protein